MIKLSSVNVNAEDVRILQDINVELSQKRIGIIGLNGSGKSTFSRLLNGLQLPSSGSVIVDDFDTKKDARNVRRKVGFVFQNPENQIVYPTVKEDLAFGLKNLKVAKGAAEILVSSALEKYDLVHLADRFTHRLSGGEMQMIALIGVMIMTPEYIVFDEPTTLLDLKNTRRLMSAILDLDQSVFLVTHDLELVSDFDRILCFHNGKVYADGTPDNVIPKYRALCDEC